jgi:serine/threonine protein kinase
MAQPIQDSRWVGRILRDRWRIDGRIARGGMGSVFAATHKNNGSTAAIKILHPEFSRDKDTRARFLQEGYAANHVNHPGVVRILDDDVTDEGVAYLVMELLEGELVEQRRIRKGGKLPLAEVYDIADQLLDVLAAAHAKDIVHRDIKPDNLFLTNDGRLKVLDFGFAQVKTGFRTEQTATGFLLGTPGFMAPEQAIGNRPLIDAQTDLWAVGATMFMLITGEPVHLGDSPAEMLVAAANYSARPIGSVDPHLPTRLASAIDRALAFDKHDRWPDARSMQTALRLAGQPEPRKPIRRSVVDPEERFARWQESVPADDRTLMDTVEDVSAADLSEKSGETIIAQTEPHPADGEKETSIFEEELTQAAPLGQAPASSGRVPKTAGKRVPSFHNLDDVPTDETLVMNTRPKRRDAASPVGLAKAPISRPGFAQPQTPSHAAEPPFRQPYPSNREIVTSTTRVPAHKGGSRWLVYVVVAGMTMIVVILTGLLVILALD